VTRIVEPKTAPAGRSRQDAVYAQMLGLEEDQTMPPVKRFGHMGIAITGGFIWPGWSRSREVFTIEPYNPSQVTGADILRGQELAAEHGW
jgi:hypothetical protein